MSSSDVATAIGLGGLCLVALVAWALDRWAGRVEARLQQAAEDDGRG